MIPLYEKIDNGTDNQIRWRLNPVALLALTYGWKVQTFVYPELLLEPKKEALNG